MNGLLPGEHSRIFGVLIVTWAPHESVQHRGDREDRPSASLPHRKWMIS